jgi:ketosteroid isomerase-like protein
MKRRLAVTLSLAVLASLVGVSLRASARLTQKDEVVDFVESYDKAWNSKDVASVERALATNYVYFTSKGAVSSRQSTLDLLRSPKYILKSAERSEISVYRTGDTSIVSSRWKGNGSYNGEEFRDDQRCSIVLAREGRRWKVLSEHCTQIVAP